MVIGKKYITKTYMEPDIDEQAEYDRQQENDDRLDYEAGLGAEAEAEAQAEAERAEAENE